MVRRHGDGRFRIDNVAIANEAKLDGKLLLRTTDDTLTLADLVKPSDPGYLLRFGQRTSPDSPIAIVTAPPSRSAASSPAAASSSTVESATAAGRSWPNTSTP